MRPKRTLRNFLSLAGSSALFATQSASAATYYWDTNSTAVGLGDNAGTWGGMNAGSSRIVINLKSAIENHGLHGLHGL